MPKSSLHSSSEKPLLGAILCCTALSQEQRSQYSEWAKELGAEYHLDLTTEVTHLLVGSTDTDKYRYVAREREDIKVVRPEWVEAVRERWMNAQALDLEILENEYRLPILFRLKICITGFDDLAFRAQLQKNVIENGGQYTGDLTKDATHLIAAKPEGKKYEYGLQWQIKVVSIKWYKETLQRGMQLDELLYAPTTPFDEQGKGAWMRCKSNPQPLLGKRARDESSATEPARKLRRTASTKLGSQTDCLWNDIVGGPTEAAVSTRKPGVRPSKSAPVLRPEHESEAPDPSSYTIDLRVTTVLPPLKGFLKGVFICIHGFDQRRTDILKNIVDLNAGHCVRSLEQVEEFSTMKSDDNHYIQLMPHDNFAADGPNHSDIAVPIETATELWLEQCMSQKRFIEPTAYPLGSPLGPRPIDGFVELSINATGFSALETLHISKVVRVLGAKYEEVFTARVSVLVCSSADINPQKVQHAREWAIPAVTEDWLWLCIKGKKKAMFDHYLLYNQANQRRKRRASSGNPPDDRPSAEREAEVIRPAPLAKKVDTAVQPSTRRKTSSEISVYEDTSQEMLLQPDPQPTTNVLPQPITAPSKPARTNAPTSGVLPRDKIESVAMSNILTTNANGDDSMNSAIKELLNIKAKVGAVVTGVVPAKPEGEGTKKRFFGRALSNLSNSSVTSNVRYSRAGSVDSLNTDGFGSEIGIERNDKVIEPSNLSRKASFSFTGRAKERIGSHPATDRSLEDDLRRRKSSQENSTPQLTQLGYEEPAETIMLRRKLAQVIEQGTFSASEAATSVMPVAKEVKLLRDDVLSADTGWGLGRRTRHKDRER